MLDALIPEPKGRKDGRAAELGANRQDVLDGILSLLRTGAAIGALNAAASPVPAPVARSTFHSILAAAG